MKNSLYIAFILFLLSSCNSPQKSNYTFYGDIVIDSTKAISVYDMLTQLEQNPGKTDYTFFAPIQNAFQVDNKWVFSVEKEKGEFLNVRLKKTISSPLDYEKGSIAYFHGNVVWDNFTKNKEFNNEQDELLKLYFEADGVLLPKVISSTGNKK